MISVRRSPSVATPAFICIAGGAFFALLFYNYYPGMLNLDSADMLCQAVHNRFHDWHSPLMSLTWRYLDKIVPGPPLMLALIQGAYIFGACLFAVQLSSNQFLRVGCVALLAFWPPILNALGLITKDSMCLWITLLFIVSLFRLIIRPSNSMLAAALVFALLGIAVRIDMAAYFVAGLVVSYKAVIDRSYGGVSGPRRPMSQELQWLFASGVAVITIVGCVGVVSIFNYKLMQATPRFAIQTILIQDIAGISVRAGQNLLPDYAVRAGIDLDLLRERYTPRYVDPLLFGATPNVPITTKATELKELWIAWCSAIVAHPIEYIGHRLATFVYLLDIIRPNPTELYEGHTDPRSEKYCPELRAENFGDPQAIGVILWRDEAMPTLLNTFVFRGYAYDAIAFIALLIALGRIWLAGKDAIDQLIIAVIVAAGLHQIGLLFLSPGAYFRYLMPTVLSCVIAVLLLLARRAKYRVDPLRQIREDALPRGS